MTPALRRADAMGIPAFRLYLVESLMRKFPPADGTAPELVEWLLLHTAVQAGQGHICTDLDRIREEMPDWYASETDPDLPSRLAGGLEAVLGSGERGGLIERLDRDGQEASSLALPRPPLVLSADGRRLYFLKRRREEDRLVDALSRRVRGVGAPATAFPLPSSLPDSPAGALMERLASGRRLLILAGGPGTGKTTAIASLLDLVDAGRREAGIPPAEIALAAPTGRAASRMSRSGRTLHALLGISPFRPPRFDADRPLAADLVVVDEASMVDLSMMNALLAAVPPEAALVLVGDPGQLPSVEAGALLGDLIAGAKDAADAGVSGPLADSVLRLTRVYRSSRSILQAAEAVRRGDDEALNAVLGTGVRRHDPGDPRSAARRIAEFYADGTEGRAVLTPLRRGGWGVPALNDRVSFLIGGTTAPFEGMPVMIDRNDPDRNLWNGDRGVMRRVNGRLRALFGESGESRDYSLAVLPGWEPAWVQTIHKSQGSEFDEILVLLPEGADRLLSREILYTALTRARNRVDLYADPSVLRAALSRGVMRHSRLKCWAAGAPESCPGNGPQVS